MPVPFVLTCLGNIGGSVLGKVGDYLVAPIQRQFKYMCCLDSNITELEAQLEMFQRTRQGLKLRVDNDRANVRIIDPNVEAWLRSANEVTSEVVGILTQEKPKVKEGCLNGWCPNVKLRYSLSRRAVKQTEVVVELQTAAVSYSRTSYSPPPTSKETIPNEDSKGFESRRVIMEEIIMALKHDEINLIGVCGMGGVGKTTMVNEVAKRAKEDNQFDEVAMAIVGQEPNLTNIQACIADMLGLKLGDRDSPIVRANLLRKRLLQDNNKILVILDDIWAELDLLRMGIPLGCDNKNLKMLYTSRIQDLWHDRRTKKEICVELLLEEEAWQLFKEKVGDSADALDLQRIAKQIVKECGRLPLALVLIGSTLSKSKGNHIKEIWEDMLYRLNCCSLNKDLSELLETSYKYLENEDAKRLFLLCCLFKEDESIRIEDLVRYAFGISILDGIYEITRARHRVVALVSDLKSRYLLLECKDLFLRECVKVHDVVRDMGISIASRDKGALVSHGTLSEWPRKDTYEHYTAISVISEKIKELPEGLTYPNLEFLMLRSSNLEKLPRDFFEGMGKLKVFYLNNFHGILTFQPLRNLTTLSLEGFGGVLDNVCAIGDLQNLEILSFRNSYIKELPEEIGELVNLRLLDLDATRSLKRIPRGVISRLVCLEELYMLSSGFKNWEEEEGMENANLGEFKSLSDLNTLEIDILLDEITIPSAPIFAKLKMYKVFIGSKCGEFIWIRKGQAKRVLSVYGSTPTPSYPFISLLRSSDFLSLGGEGCNDLVRELLLRDGVDGLQQLKQLEIYDCDTPECLANTMNLFPVLECLRLYSLSYLRQICRGPVPTGSFREITELVVKKCGLLENLFELPIGGCFAQLKILTIKSCIMMKEVFRKQQRGDVPDATKRIEFPKLETLELKDLPSLVGFCGGIDQIDFPKLESMDLKSLGKFKRLFNNNNNNLSSNSSQEDNFGFLSLFPQKVSLPNLEVLHISKLENQETLGCDLLSVGSLSKLKEFCVYYCGKLLCLFPSQLVPMLRNLERLTVERCDLLEVVFELEGVDTKEPNPEILSALKVVKLCDLPKLIYISKGDPIGFNYIQTLEIDRCHSLRYVFAPTVVKSISQLRKLTIRECEMLSRIVADENGMGESTVDEVKFPQLEILELCDLPNLVSLFPDVNIALPKFTDRLHNPMQAQSLFNEKVAIPILKYLKLQGLKNVSDLWCSDLPSSSFSKLVQLEVICCTGLRNIFRPSMAGGLGNLKERQGVVGNEEVEGHERKIDKVEFPQLEGLELCDLPSLVGFCGGIDQIDFPKLECMRLKSLGKFKQLFNNNSNMSSNSEQKDNFNFLSLFPHKVSLPNLAVLNISKLEYLETLGHDALSVGSLSKLRAFSLRDCGKLLCAFPSQLVPILQKLEQLTVESCYLLEVVFELEGADTKEPNPEILSPLKNVKLCNLPKLIYISKGDPIGFKYILTLEIDRCHRLRYVFAPTVVKSISQLYKLTIRGCKMLSRIVAEENGMGESTVNEVKFPRLERLVLLDLPNLVSLFPNVNIALPKSTDRLHNPMQPQSLFNEKVVIPSLKYLELLGLENVSDLWCNELSSSFFKLEQLKVIRCMSLRNVFHHSMAGGLINLKELVIHFCSTLEVVVGKEEEVEGHERKIDKVEFPKLERLELHDLPNLVSLFLNVNIALPKSIDRLHNPMQPQYLFNEKVATPSLKYLELHGLKTVSDLWYSELPSSSFSKLEQLDVIRCTSLRNVFYPSMAGGLENLKELLIHFCSTLEVVVGKEEEVEGYERKIDKVEFPQLKRLELCDLPSLVGFCGGIDQIDFPKLECVLLKSLEKFKRLFNNNSNLSSNSEQKDNCSFLSLFPHKVAIPSLKYLELVGLKNVSDLWCSELPSNSFSKLEKLEVIGCTSLRNMFHPSMAGGLVNLKELIIHFCSTLEAVVGKEEEVEGGHERKIDKVEFPQLERLDLHDLPNLVSLFPNVNTALPKSTDRFYNPMQPQSLINEKVAIPSLKYLKLLGLKNVSDLWCSELSSSSFSKLEKLEVIGCTSLRNMFHPSMARGFVNLKELLIYFCSTLEMVVGKEEQVEGERKIDKVEFPQLERLDIYDLPNLVSLFPNVNTALPESTDRLYNPVQPQALFNEKVAIASLEYLKLQLENVIDLWCNELPSSSFSKLEKLEVNGCASLRNMFHPSMPRGLVNLKKLLIEVCSTLELLVGKEEVGGGHGSKIDNTLFPHLLKLELGSLSNLKRFCNSTHPLELPKLSKMDILFCPSMDAFSLKPVSAPNLSLPGLSWNGDLNNAIQFLQKNGDDPIARSMEKPRTSDDVTDKFKPWQVAETQCRLVSMPDSTDGAHKVARLIYTNSGNGVLALGCNGIMRLWKWAGSQQYPSGMATASVVPQQWQPASGLAMTNDVTGAKLEEAVPCIALVKNDYYVFSARGGVISLFDMTTFKVMKTFMRHPPASTFLALYPLDNKFIAIGREDSTIHIYNVMKNEVICTLYGHQKRITGLAFSTNLKILVSSGADAQLCIWSIDTWVKLKSVPIQLPAGKARDCDTRVQFHSGQIRLLVSHETQLAIYGASKMDRICQWVPQDVLPAPISCATYSCDGQLVYTSFCDGNIGVFDADSLTLRCRIVPSAYLPPSLSSGSQALYPLVVAPHPQLPNQFAIGLTDGSVIVMEPPTIRGLEGGTASSSNPSNQTPYQGEDIDVEEHLDSDSHWDWELDSDFDSFEDVDEVLDKDVDEDKLIMNRKRTATIGLHDSHWDWDLDSDFDSFEDVDEVLDKDVDEDKLIMNRKRTATIGLHDEEEDLEKKRKKEEKEKKGKAPLAG